MSTSLAGLVAPVGHPVKVVDTDAHEGPVYAADEDALYVTSRPSATHPSLIRRIGLDGNRFPIDPAEVTDVLAPVVMPNGMVMDAGGHLVVCEQGDRSSPACLSRVDRRTGDRTVLVDGWRGRPLSSPNDVAVHRDGSVWFTDPGYGFLQGFRPAPQLGDFVYRLDVSTGVADVVADGFTKPNGITFSPDCSVLYVTDSGANSGPGTFDVHLPHHVVAFDVRGRHLTGRRLLSVVAPGVPDGITVDVDGRVYVSCDDGVLVLSGEGDLLAFLDVPGAVNFTFGGPGRDVLFITADTAVWAVALDTTGA